MLYGRKSLAFFLFCILCIFPRSCCELKLKKQLLTLKRNSVPYKDVIECQDCILKVAGAMRATRYRGDASHPEGPDYTQTQYMVTGSDFAFMGIHSKCAMLKVCGVFEVEDPPSTSDEPTERNRFVFGKPTPWTELWEFEYMERNQKLETRMRDPMCFTLEPTEATSQIRSCLKEASSSSLIREYSVRLDEGLLTRSIILLYPQDNNQQPKEIHRSCQHLNLAVDSSKYVPVAKCRKLSVQTCIVETTTSFVEPTRST
ncbi:unnamed protein product [Albugo candida]|uniref:Uncharacterized protein n=1 Tax=Albugo candida TaxID=65357 RepID=A0A024GLG9_9STRA|nr:unnamed protein product [Albugo candida]|eukprot:CCI47614.1 unnamed protein product [Albugo candida]